MKQEFPDLENATVGQEVNPLVFDPREYPESHEMLSRILNSDDRIEIKCEDLSVNGTVVKDEMETYLKTKAVSNSALKEALKTPLHYYVYCNDETPKKPKEHFELGTFIHMAFLEPELFDRCVVGPEDAPMNDLEGVQKWVDFYEANTNITRKIQAREAVKLLDLDIEKMKGKKAYIKELKKLSKITCVDADHAQIIKLVKRHYYTYGGGIIPKILKGAMFEASMYGTDPESGLPVKIRPDAINVEENIGVNAIISFKSTRSQTKGKFEMDCANQGYHIGEGMYQKVASHITGRKFNCTIMIMIQTVAPFLPAVFWWNPDDLHLGKLKYDMGMQCISDAMEKGIYPGFDVHAESGNYGIIDMKLPEWIQRDVDPVELED